MIVANKYAQNYLISNRCRLVFAFVVLISLWSKALLADTITVSSIAGLQKAVNAAKPGDVILLVDGVYTTREDIVVNNKGTKKQPITVAAQHLGLAEITGQGGF